MARPLPRQSRLFLVWQRFQDERVRAGDFAVGRERDRLFDAPARNVFTVKVDLWMGI